MTAARQCFLAGQDITNWLLDWGQLDEIKSVLLDQAQLFVGQVTVKVDNTSGIFSPGNPSSFLYGQVELNQPITLWQNGVQVFGGLLKDSEPDNDSQQASLVMENQFSNLANTVVVTVQNGVNPALALLGLLNTYGFSAYVNAASFVSSAGPALAAGATINLNYAASNQAYLLQVINDISAIAGLSVFVQNNVIYCTVFQAYQGSGSGLRQPISSAVVRTWGTRKAAYNTFYNQVIVPYGASSKYQADNTVSQGQTKTTSSFSFNTNTGQVIAVPDLVSATFFGGQYLLRASTIRDLIQVDCGVEMADAVIGYRYPVTNSNWGYVSKAFEVIETLRTLSDIGISLTLASL